MDEEVLLDMYRGAWDAFLEAYKDKDDQNEALIKLIGNIIDLTKEEKAKNSIKEQLGFILEA